MIIQAIIAIAAICHVNAATGGRTYPYYSPSDINGFQQACQKGLLRCLKKRVNIKIESESYLGSALAECVMER